MEWYGDMWVEETLAYDGLVMIWLLGNEKVFVERDGLFKEVSCFTGRGQPCLWSTVS